MSEEKKTDNSYKIVKPGKRLLSFLADIFILFIIASGLYSVAIYPLMQRTPTYKSTFEEQEVYVEKCRKMYYDGHLMRNGETASSHIDKSIKEKISDSNNDIFIHYYTEYLPTIHKDEVAYSYDIQYVNKMVYGYESQGDIVLYRLDNDDINKPLVFTESAVEMLNKYFNGDVTKESESYYNKVVSQYQNSLINAEKILVSSDEYRANYTIVSKDNTVLYLYVSVSCTITYSVFFVILFIVFPLLFKNGQTIGKKIMKIGLYHDTRNPIRPNILILRSILQYIMYYFIVIFIPVWQIGMGFINLPAFVFPGFTINLFALAFVSLILALVSFVVMTVTENKQALHDKVVGIYAYRMDVQLEEENEIKNKEFFSKENEGEQE